jgi:ferredoxin-NADP reductase
MPTNVSTTYTAKLMKREFVAEGTMAFHFEKPKEFQFTPGQYVDVTLLNPPETDAEGNIRSFSIASAPFEDHITLVTRMRDTAFKRVLKSAPLGVEAKLEGPMGSFTLHKNASKAAVFLAGGIGITPFFSILRGAAHEKLPQRLYLFYSNRRPEDAAFLRELRQLEEVNQHFRFVPTMTEMAKSHQDWKGQTGFIDRQMVTRFLPELHGPIYYIAGPPAMVAAMRQMLVTAGVDEDDVRTEEFAGY